MCSAEAAPGVAWEMKVRHVLEKLKAAGWYELPRGQTSGSHRQYKHPTLPGRVTVAGKPSADIPEPTLKRIYEQAGWGKP